MRTKMMFAGLWRFVGRVSLSLIVLTTILTLGTASWAQVRWQAGPEAGAHSPMTSNPPSASLTGTVTAAGVPLSGATVRLQNPATGATVATTVSSPVGEFEIKGIQPGDYELIAEYQIQTVENHISIQPLQPPIEIRFPGAPSSSPNVSVAELQVPERARSKLQDAQKALAKNDLRRAEEKLTEALKVAPRYAAALALRGVLLLNAGEPAKAANEADRAIHSDPNYPYAYFVMGAALNQMNRYADAQRAADQGLRLEPRAWQGHYELARALIGQGKVSPALGELNRAIETAPPTFAQLHLVRGTTLLALHQSRESAQELQEYLKLDPNTPISNHVRALLQEAQTQTAAEKP